MPDTATAISGSPPPPAGARFAPRRHPPWCERHSEEGSDCEALDADFCAWFCGHLVDCSGAATSHGSPASDDELTKSAMSPAPPAVAKAATILAVDAAGRMQTIRKGINHFTCLPACPTTRRR